MNLKKLPTEVNNSKKASLIRKSKNGQRFQVDEDFKVRFSNVYKDGKNEISMEEAIKIATQATSANHKDIAVKEKIPEIVP